MKFDKEHPFKKGSIGNSTKTSNMNVLPLIFYVPFSALMSTCLASRAYMQLGKFQFSYLAQTAKKFAVIFAHYYYFTNNKIIYKTYLFLDI